jgi:hypothetical protein
MKTKTTDARTPADLAAAKAAREAEKAAKDAKTKAIRDAALVAVAARWDAIPTTAPCGCGCGEPVPVRRFRPGHDAKLKSRMLAEETAKATGAAERVTTTTETPKPPKRDRKRGANLSAQAQA